jgi:hypothetical protein
LLQIYLDWVRFCVNSLLRSHLNSSVQIGNYCTSRLVAASASSACSHEIRVVRLYRISNHSLICFAQKSTCSHFSFSHFPIHLTARDELQQVVQ